MDTKTRPLYTLSTRDPPRNKGHIKTESEGQEKDIPCKCAGQEATVRTGHGTTHWFQIGKGVSQGYILSPCLFNMYSEYLM